MFGDSEGEGVFLWLDEGCRKRVLIIGSEEEGSGSLVLVFEKIDYR